MDALADPLVRTYDVLADVQWVAVDGPTVDVGRLVPVVVHQLQRLVLQVADLLWPLLDPGLATERVQQQPKTFGKPPDESRRLLPLLAHWTHRKELHAQLERPTQGVRVLDRDARERLLTAALRAVAVLRLPLVTIEG